MSVSQVQTIMVIRQTEAQTTDAHGMPAPRSVSEEYIRSEQGAAIQSDRTTTAPVTTSSPAVDRVSHVDIGEAIRVTLCIVGLSALTYAIIHYLTYATAGMLMPFPVAPGTLPKVISFVVSTFNIVAVGTGVGLLANRRTMAASILVANLAVISVTALTLACVIYATLPPEAWAASIRFMIGMLFYAVTSTFTEIAIALYVSRKFRTKA